MVDIFPKIPNHEHNGIDSPQVSFDNIADRTLPIPVVIQDTSAATAANYGVFWTAPFPCYVVGFTETHKTAGSDAGAVTLQLEKLNSGEALDAGDTLLSTALSLKTTANTPQEGTLVTTIATRQLATGDRLALKDAGTLTAVAHVVCVVTVRY